MDIPEDAYFVGDEPMTSWQYQIYLSPQGGGYHVDN
jgi:hypothetical protein